MISEADMTPKEVVDALDEYIIGQDEAKKAVAVALRNRYRRLQLDDQMQEEITPKNILMIGPTGVGKTEIARRLAHIVKAPFTKVEATKFTEVGYIGRDVESMVRDLVEQAIRIIRQEKQERITPEARNNAIKRVAKALAPGEKKSSNYGNNPFGQLMQNMGGEGQGFFQQQQEEEEVTPELEKEREEIVQDIKNGRRLHEEVTISVAENKQPMGGMNPGLEQMGIDLSSLSALQPERRVERTVTVEEAVDIFTDEERDKMVKVEDIQGEAIKLAQNSGIIFLDEIDKITSKNEQSGEVSREGVQRDILPIVEGTTVQTKYGNIKTDHILFIGSGAFSMSKPNDLIPELQGRFPIRVELDDLTDEDFFRILTEPNNALIKQYQALLATENIAVQFSHESIERIAEIAYNLNNDTENIGARRLHTILEKVLEELLFESPDMTGGEVTITAEYVDEKVADIAEDEDLSRYIL